MIKRFVLSLAISLTVTAITLYVTALRPLQRRWGVEPNEAASPLPGDGAVSNPTVSDTRGITIEATPAQIWPWLLQMGYHRAGWYSYDRLDNLMASVRDILPEYQALAVGDIVPTYPGGGFRVEALEPERALVLYLDSELVAAQTVEAEMKESGAIEPAKGVEPESSVEGEAPAAEAQGEPAAEAAAPKPLEAAHEQMPTGLKFSGAVGQMAMPEFKASWAFALQPIDEHATRLIERFRVSAPASGPMQRIGMPFMGLGVFLMSRKQMLGIKERAEQGPHTSSEPLSTAA